MALMNRRLNPRIHTVFFMTSAAHIFMSSSLVKDICKLGGDISTFVPPASAVALRRKLDVDGAAGAGHEQPAASLVDEGGGGSAGVGG
jgi:pantetheine-phosphate adenylyltransferase